MSAFDPDKFKAGRKNDAASAKLREEIEKKATLIKDLREGRASHLDLLWFLPCFSPPAPEAS